MLHVTRPKLSRASVLALCIAAHTACAADFTWDDKLLAEPGNHISFVRSYDGKVAATDWSLRELIDANTGTGKRWSAVDVIMQQCYGGGFINDIIGDGKAAATVTTSAHWNQVSWTIQERDGYDLAVQNFTRAWTDAVKASSKAGMRELAHTARANDWTGSLSPPFIPARPEYPQYGSRDAAPGGANDLRSPVQGKDERVFTAAVIFGDAGKMALRHAVNAARVVRTMQDVSAVDQVALLFEPNARAIDLTANVFRPDPKSLGRVAISGDNSAAGLKRALDGSQFGTEAKAGDRLLLYFTGHGAEATFAPNRVTSSSASEGGVVDRQKVIMKLVVDPNAVGNAGQTENAPFAQREGGGFSSDSFNPNMFGDRDDVGGNIDEIQLSFARAVGADTRFLVNGFDLTASARLLTDPSEVRELPQRTAQSILPTPAQVWEISAPFEVTNAQSDITFELTGLDTELAIDPDLVAGISLWRGDRELVFINTPVPESGKAPMLGAGLLVLAAWRRLTSVKPTRFL